MKPSQSHSSLRAKRLGSWASISGACCHLNTFPELQVPWPVQVKPWEMWDHISWGSTKWENTTRYMFISDNRASEWQLEHWKQCLLLPTCAQVKSSLKALLAPWKQLSRQKNSTNSRAQVRWLNILSASFRDYSIATPSHPCYMGCKKSAKHASHKPPANSLTCYD